MILPISASLAGLYSCAHVAGTCQQLAESNGPILGNCVLSMCNDAMMSHDMVNTRLCLQRLSRPVLLQRFRSVLGCPAARKVSSLRTSAGGQMGGSRRKKGSIIGGAKPAEAAQPPVQSKLLEREAHDVIQVQALVGLEGCCKCTVICVLSALCTSVGICCRDLHGKSHLYLLSLALQEK